MTFYFPKRAAQLIDFEGFEYKGVIKPTNVDFIVEIGFRLLVVGEVKLACDRQYDHGRSMIWRPPQVPGGQAGLLEALVDVWTLNTAIRHALGFVAVHDVLDPTVHVPLARCQVVAVYREQRWIPLLDGSRVLDVVDHFMAEHGVVNTSDAAEARRKLLA